MSTFVLLLTFVIFVIINMHVY